MTNKYLSLPKEWLTLHLSRSKKSQISPIPSTATITFCACQLLKGGFSWHNVFTMSCKICRKYVMYKSTESTQKRRVCRLSSCNIAQNIILFPDLANCAPYVDLRQQTHTNIQLSKLMKLKILQFLVLDFHWLSSNVHWLFNPMFSYAELISKQSCGESCFWLRLDGVWITPVKIPHLFVAEDGSCTESFY